MRHKISIFVTKIFWKFPVDWNCLVIVHDLLFAHFDNCLPPFYSPSSCLKGKCSHVPFYYCLRLLKGSGLFTHFCFLASSIEHILFTLNKYWLIERRIISNFSISTDTWTLTFLRALIRQVYEGGECCLGIACSPALECETLVCVGRRRLVQHS